MKCYSDIRCQQCLETNIEVVDDIVHSISCPNSHCILDDKLGKKINKIIKKKGGTVPLDRWWFPVAGMDQRGEQWANFDLNSGAIGLWPKNLPSILKEYCKIPKHLIHSALYSIDICIKKNRWKKYCLKRSEDKIARNIDQNLKELKRVVALANHQNQTLGKSTGLTGSQEEESEEEDPGSEEQDFA